MEEGLKVVLFMAGLALFLFCGMMALINNDIRKSSEEKEENN
jgi:hypothetical protein